MATLATLKTRIQTEMVRDDLATTYATELLTHIQAACEFYAHEGFWFNQIVTTATTTASQSTVNTPSTVRIIDKITIPAMGAELREVTLPDLDPVQTAQTGLPSWYSCYGDTIKLYPVPDAVYTLQITGIKAVAAPSSDSDDNIWTNEAKELICARTRMTLYRDLFRDPEGAQMAIGAVQDAYAKLRRETGKRNAVPLRANEAKARFNINYA